MWASPWNTVLNELPAEDATANLGHEAENLLGTWTVVDLNLPFYPDAEFTDQGLQADSHSNI